MEYLTINDLQARLKIGKTSIYKLVGEGDFPIPVKFGGSVRWPVKAVEKYEEEKVASSKWSSYRKALQDPEANGALERAVIDLELSASDIELHREILAEHERLVATTPKLEAELEAVPDAGRPPWVLGGDFSANRDAFLVASGNLRIAQHHLAALEDFTPGLFGRPIRENSEARFGLPVDLQNHVHRIDAMRAREAAEQARREAAEERKQKLREAREKAANPEPEERFFK
jgi:predicted DNA-binding transcriptional regulator AlpA